MPSIRVGIAGATGYGGQELLRLAARHPHAEVTVAMASGTSDGARTIPALTGVWNGAITPFSIDQLVTDTDIVFLALPEGASATTMPELVHARKAGLRPIWRVPAPGTTPPEPAGIPRARHSIPRLFTA